MRNYEATILAQYANSPIITGLIGYTNQEMRPDIDLDNFYNYVWDVDNAQGFGLDILGRIVNISRNINIPGTDINFGFEEALPGSYPFGQAPFYSGHQATTVYTLDDQAYRLLVLTKAFINICNFTCRSLNALLQILFAGRGPCYCLDLGNMTMKYVFEFELLVWELSLFQSLLPHPAGVLATIQVVPIEQTFGFQEGGFPPFGLGNFFF